MKLLLLTFFLASLSGAGCAQTTQPPDSLFLVTFSLGPSWDKAKPAGEQKFFKEHGATLGALRKEGIIRLGARYADKGMIVIAATSSAAAKEIIFKDPGVAAGLFSADIQKLNVFYYGCLEKEK